MEKMLASQSCAKALYLVLGFVFVSTVCFQNKWTCYQSYFLWSQAPQFQLIHKFAERNLKEYLPNTFKRRERGGEGSLSLWT